MTCFYSALAQDNSTSVLCTVKVYFVASSYTNRDYQQRAEDELFSLWGQGFRSVLIVLFTGGGKTVIAGNIAKRLQPGQRMLFQVHREELAYQSQQKLQEITGRQVALEMSGRKAFIDNPDAPIVVAMCQSMCKRLAGYKRDHFHVFAQDEAHHLTAPQYRAAYDYYDWKFCFGLTATPMRSDGVALGKVFDKTCLEMMAIEGIEQGWLTPIRSRVETVADMDLSKVKIDVGDFNSKQLNEQLTKQSVIHTIAAKTLAIASGRQTVLFCRAIDQSQAVAAVMRQMGASAEHIDGKTGKGGWKWGRYVKGERERKMDRFRDGSLQVLTNVGLIDEGVDVPGIEVVGNASPTRSQSRIIQRVGRGLRPVEPPQGMTPEERRAEIAGSHKPHCTVIDFLGGQMGEHFMRVSGDLLGGEYDDEVRKVAIQLASKFDGEFVDWADIYAKAAAIVAEREKSRSVAEERRQQMSLLRAEENRWAFKKSKFDPPCPFEVLGIEKRDASEFRDDAYGRALQDAKAFLSDAGFTDLELQRLSNTEQYFLGREYWKLCRRIPDNRASWKQMRLLYVYGYKPKSYRFRKTTACGIMARVENAGWVRPLEDGVNEYFLADTGKDVVPAMEREQKQLAEFF